MTFGDNATIARADGIGMAVHAGVSSAPDGSFGQSNDPTVLADRVVLYLGRSRAAAVAAFNRQLAEPEAYLSEEFLEQDTRAVLPRLDPAAAPGAIYRSL